MLIEIIEWLKGIFGEFGGSGLINYVTFRAGVATILSLMISLVFGGRIIRFLKKLQVGELVRDLGLEGQKQKEGTPTMGGVIIIMAILIPCWLMAKLDNIYIILMIVTTIWMGIIGFIDDYIKVFLKNKKGLRGRFKIMGQVGLGLIIGITMLVNNQVVVRMDAKEAERLHITEQIKGDSIFIEEKRGFPELRADYKTSLTNVPFLKGNNLDYSRLVPASDRKTAQDWVWVLFIPMVILVVTSVSNAANLTDGIDGLATGVSGIIGMVLGIFAYVSSNAITANYLDIMHLPGTEELVIFAACFLGACLGFLWHNSFPASVFMGDTGSLTLGGIIAAMAILLRKELLVPVLCGVFFMETLSVLIQVTYFKYTKRKYGEGRRVFRMSPLHHHFQKGGMHESKIVTRFLIISVLLAVFTILTLKIR